MEKFYDYISPEDKKIYSLNFFLSEKVNTIPIIPIKMMQRKSIDAVHNNEEQSNFLFYKYISRCASNLEGLNAENL